MSQFLSNIFSRHNQKANVVRPRGLGIFETHQSWPGSIPYPSETEYVDRNTNLNPSDGNINETHIHQAITNKSQEDTSVQQDHDIIREADHQRFDTHVKKTGSNIKRFVNEMEMNSKVFPDKDAELKNETRQLKTKLSDLKSNKKILIPYSQRVDKQIPSPILEDRILVRPKKKINQQLLSKFNINGQNEDSIKSNTSNDTSNINQSQTIKIHIGRIDIKAVKQNSTKTKQTQNANKPGMSLEQFLKKREGKS